MIVRQPHAGEGHHHPDQRRGPARPRRRSSARRRGRRRAARTCCCWPSRRARSRTPPARRWRRRRAARSPGWRPGARCGGPSHVDAPGPTGHDREEREDRREGEDGAEVEEERVGVLRPEVLLEEHLQRVGGDVEHAAERTAAEPGKVDGGAVGADAVLHHRAPLALGEREQGGDDHHEDRAEDRAGCSTPAPQVAARSPAAAGARQSTASRRCERAEDGSEDDADRE